MSTLCIILSDAESIMIWLIFLKTTVLIRVQFPLISVLLLQINV